ncbi:MAG: hypothetical protein HKN33_12910 [Pyrinomonadaceae bacterium]|nr:hypothetical protein [Pyrinomonadaceae bacterium]
MAMYVSDASSPDAKKVKYELTNSTEIEIVYQIGEDAFTLHPGQSKKVRANAEASVEARPLIIGVESGFIVGGTKVDCAVKCEIVTDSDKKRRLLLEKS